MCLDVVTLLDFDDLPSVAQRYVTYCAAQRAATQLVTNTELTQLIQQQTGMLRAQMTNFECEQADANFMGFQDPAVYQTYHPFLYLGSLMNITQTIPSYIFGISEQPDMRKKPGQVTAMDNALPDITSGLVKRPGTRLVQATLTNEPGKWFNIYRDENEQYVGHVRRSNGDIRIWNAFNWS